MKRAEQLYKLSHQHHNGLMAVLLLKKGIAKNTALDVLNGFIINTWQNELRTHFIKEEVYLHPHFLHLPGLMPMYEQMKAEHHAIRRMINTIRNGESSVALIISFYTLLEKHIRFEERLFFEYIQQHIQPEQLAAVAKSLDDLPASTCSNYPIKFWE